MKGIGGGGGHWAGAEHRKITGLLYGQSKNQKKSLPLLRGRRRRRSGKLKENTGCFLAPRAVCFEKKETI